MKITIIVYIVITQLVTAKNVSTRRQIAHHVTLHIYSIQLKSKNAVLSVLPGNIILMEYAYYALKTVKYVTLLWDAQFATTLSY